MELVALNTQDLLDRNHQRYEEVEAELFRLREAAENIWVRIAELCSEVVEYKLYKYGRDEEGNYFRTAKKYFEYLDMQFRARGWRASPSTLNHWMDIYHLFVKEMGFSPDDIAALGVTNSKRLAPAIRQLQREGRGDEAHQAVDECVTAAKVNNGLPLSEVVNTIEYLTGQVEKGMEVKFKKMVFGYALDVFRLWWGGKPIDLLAKQQVTDDQRDWMLRRLGQRPE